MGPNEVVNVRATNGPLGIDGYHGDANDTVNLGDPAANTGLKALGGLRGAVTVTGADDNVTLSVKDAPDTTVRTATITSAAITGLAPTPIHYQQAALAAINIDGSGGFSRLTGHGSTYNFLSTPDAGQATITATTITNHGIDYVNVGNAGSMLGIKGNLMIASPLHATSLRLDGSTDSTPPSGGRFAGPIIIEANQIAGLAPADIVFGAADLVALTVSTPKGGRTIDVEGTPNQGDPGTVVTSVIGHGPDTVYVGDVNGRVDGIQGSLNLTNPPNYDKPLVVDDSSDPKGRSVTVSPGLITGLTPGDITYATSDVGAINLLAGTGADTFHVLGGLASAPLTIDGGTGANTLIGPDVARTWNITGNDAGKFGNVTFQRFGNLTGGALADTFSLANGVGVSGKIGGGGGSNTLDMSAYSGKVAVNLSLATATGTGSGIANIANVNGGQGNNILVGDANANAFRGGAGYNLMFGRGGLDQIIGGPGNNLLIGGSTPYDLKPEILDALMLEFSNAQEDFLTRLTHLLSGGGANGSSLLNSATVVADGAPNVLTGGTGPDWFFVRDGKDRITPGTLHPGDVVTKN